MDVRVSVPWSLMGCWVTEILARASVIISFTIILILNRKMNLYNILQILNEVDFLTLFINIALILSLIQLHFKNSIVH